MPFFNKPNCNKAPSRARFKVLGDILSHDERGIKVSLEGFDGEYHCVWEQITDFFDNRSGILKKTHYMFLVDKLDPSLYISYKQLHPTEIMNKRRTIPTCSHFITLKRIMYLLHTKQYETNPTTSPLPTFKTLFN